MQPQYYAEGLIARGGEALYAQVLADGLGPHLDDRLARTLVRTQAADATLRGALAAARADPKDGGEAYLTWLRGEAAAMAPEAKAGLARHGEEALQARLVPAVEPAYADYARAVLDSRVAPR